MNNMMMMMILLRVVKINLIIALYYNLTRAAVYDDSDVRTTHLVV